MSKVWLASGERRRCSNEGKTRNTLTRLVSQTPEPISAVSGPKFAILWGRVEDIWLFNKFFRLSIHALTAKIQPDKVARWCADGKFLAIFCVLYFGEPRAAHL